MPDPGSVQDAPPAPPVPEEGGQSLGALGFDPRAILAKQMQSNALLVSARKSATGHPIAVMGPQVGYFVPQILMEQDLHGPGIDARGVAFPGVNLYVQIGHGRNHAWSATTSAQDLVDTFAVPLCDETHYRFRGNCEPIELVVGVPPPGSQSFSTNWSTLSALAEVADQAYDGPRPSCT